MVCVPCFIIPLLLYIWHRFIQPIVLRYWNPWEKKDAEGNVIKAGPEFPFECKGGVCPFVPSKNKEVKEEATDKTDTDAVKQSETQVNKTALTTAADNGANSKKED